MTMHANELRQVRHELGLSQSQMAEKMGVTRGTVSRWELKSGRYPVSHMAANLVRLLAEKPLVAGDPMKPAESKPTA